jgi:hypothetical protein
MELKWESPEPPKSGFKGKWPAILAALKERPMEWALVAEDTAASNASRLKRDYPGFEFTVREVRDNRAAKLYARWLGGAQ